MGQQVSVLVLYMVTGRRNSLGIRLAYLDSILQDVTSVSFGLRVMLIVSVGIMEYVHALSPSPDMVGKLPSVLVPSLPILEQRGERRRLRPWLAVKSIAMVVTETFWWNNVRHPGHELLENPLLLVGPFSIKETFDHLFGPLDTRAVPLTLSMGC